MSERTTTVWKRFLLVLKVVEVRLRFIVILVAVGLFIGYWDTVENYWSKWTRPRVAAVHELREDQEFFCPMHPNVVRNTYEPNGDVPKCPICGMPLSIREKGGKEALPPGVTGRVQLTPERIRQAGVKTIPVARRPVTRRVTTVGYVSFDESRLTRVVARVSGYVEKLYVNKTYSVVREGEPLAEIYSPQLYSTAQELLIALGSSVSSDLAPVARDRLRLFGVSDAEIDEIARSRAARPRLVIRSPRSGYVIAKKIEVGSSVEPGMTLLDVADLSAVWIEADVFEKNVSLLKPGQTIEATVEALPNITFNGRVALIYPELQTATRTNRVRFELDNPGGALRPGMFATVRIDTALEAVSSSRTELPVVPERAVVDTGVKKIVYVEREPGLFEGVQVELGPRVQIDENSRAVDYYPVLKGLEPGQRIADAGSFLIDAETRLNPAAASTYFGASGPQGGRDESSGGRQDRQLALGQRACPITGAKLGSMGVPYKVVLKGQPVLLCCPGCEGKAKDAPDETLEKVARLKSGKSP